MAKKVVDTQNEGIKECITTRSEALSRRHNSLIQREQALMSSIYDNKIDTTTQLYTLVRGYYSDFYTPLNVTAVTIPTSWTRFPDSALINNYQVETIKLHKRVTSIGRSAFEWCVNLKYINIQESPVEIIDKWAFNRCKSLERVELPPQLKRINCHAFSECQSLIVINLSACPLLEEIEAFAFERCKSLERVELPPQLKRINCHAFSECQSLIVINLSACPLLEEIEAFAFHECTSLFVVYFPNSFLRIGPMAFSHCFQLISAELPPNVQVHDLAFVECSTLQLSQPQVDRESLADSQFVQRASEIVSLLKRQYDTNSFHKICRAINITLEQLIPTIKNSNDINLALQQRDEIGMTAQHYLCLNPNATPEMFEILANACSQAATIQAEMVTNIEYDNGLCVNETGPSLAVNEKREMVTPIKLFIKTKGISYDDNDFDEEGHITLDTVFQKVSEWNDLNSIMSIQSLNLVVPNVRNYLYPFMQAATCDEMNLETLYHLSMYDPKLIYELSFEAEPPRKRRKKDIYSMLIRMLPVFLERKT